jgi:2-(1,2-epoxy-1,2-dihydrophenyl)acetyl-CoA isomerase
MSETILVSKQGNWSEITLNRPDRLNSFTDEMHLALRESIEKARDEGARAILLTGAGRGFCAGQDLGDRDPEKMGGPPNLGHTLSTYYNPLITLIRSLEIPVVCAVNGVAAGAGANLALACDIVLAADSAKFIQSFSKVGLIPDAGGSWMLARLIGEARAKALALTAEPVSAETAMEWGMIWKMVPDEDLMDASRKLAGSLANGPTYGLGQTKQLIQTGATTGLIEHLEIEARVQKKCGESPDYAEGVSAFLRKRSAKFSGKQP